MLFDQWARYSEQGRQLAKAQGSSKRNIRPGSLIHLGIYAMVSLPAPIMPHTFVRMQRANRRLKSSRADVTAVSHVLQGLIITATKSTNYFTRLHNHFNKSTSFEFRLLHKVFKTPSLRSVAKLAYPSHSNSYSARTKQPRFPVGAAK